MNRALLILSLLIPPIGASGGGLEIPVEKHRFEAFDSKDVDYFLATFGRLTDSIESFLGGITLKAAIDRWSEQFRETVDCFTIVSGENLRTAGREITPTRLRWFLDTWVVRKCDAESIDPTGGLAVGFRSAKCRVDSLAPTGAYDSEAMSNHYLHMKTIARGEMCLVSKGKAVDGSTEMKRAKEHLGYAHSRLTVWDRIQRSDSCVGKSDMLTCMEGYVHGIATEMESIPETDRSISADDIRQIAARYPERREMAELNSDIFRDSENELVYLLREIEKSKANKELREIRGWLASVNRFADKRDAISIPECQRIVGPSPSLQDIRTVADAYQRVIEAFAVLGKECAPWKKVPQFRKLDPAMQKAVTEVCVRVGERERNATKRKDGCVGHMTLEISREQMDRTR